MKDASSLFGLYEAIFFYRDGEDGHERKSPLRFRANEADVIDDALRWWKERQRANPEVFGELLCVKAYTFWMGCVDADGKCDTGTSPFPFFEWKHDWPGTLAEQVDEWKSRRGKTRENQGAGR
jgi:hypothetical protein